MFLLALKLSSTQRLRRFSLHLLARFSLNGFSLVEVLVALMLTMIFISITMQIFVSAAFFRAKADHYNQALNWIQEDYEKVFSQASQYEAEVLPASTLCTAATPPNGLAANFLSDTARGLGGATTNIGPRTIGGKSFLLTRTGDYASSSDPYKLLKLTYTITPTDGGAAVANVNTEVVIYAGFKCPN